MSFPGSGVYYSTPPIYSFPNHQQEHPPPRPPTTTTAPSSNEQTTENGRDVRRCSVRGCHSILEPTSATKMCERCRGKHRIYATTKRARRKMEKAALTGQTIRTVEQIPGSTAWMPDPSAGKNETAPESQSETPAQAHHESPDPDPVYPEPEPTPEPPATVIPDSGAVSPAIPPPVLESNWDSRTLDPRLFRSHLTTTSELAGALILRNSPPQTVSPLSYYRHVTSAPTESPPIPEPPDPDPDPAPSSSGSQTTTQDHQTLSEGEHQARGTSAHDPDAPPRFCSVKGCKAVIAASYSYKMCEPCRDRYRGYGITKRAKWKAERIAFDKELEDLRLAEEEKRKAQGLPPLGDNPDELRAWELSILDEQVSLPPSLTAALVTSTVSPNALAVSPASLVNPAVLPARMCTVSHCHKILPGTYIYKRCEEHRVQNRFHSQLKRIREKVEKSAGPPEGSVGQLFEEELEQKARGKAKKLLVEKERKEKRKDKDEERRQSKCATVLCFNLIRPNVRWKTCDVCRAMKREERKKLKKEEEAAAAASNPPAQEEEISEQDGTDEEEEQEERPKYTPEELSSTLHVFNADMTVLEERRPDELLSANSSTDHGREPDASISPSRHFSSFDPAEDPFYPPESPVDDHYQATVVNVEIESTNKRDRAPLDSQPEPPAHQRRIEPNADPPIHTSIKAPRKRASRAQGSKHEEAPVASTSATASTSPPVPPASAMMQYPYYPPYYMPYGMPYPPPPPPPASSGSNGSSSNPYQYLTTGASTYYPPQYPYGYQYAYPPLPPNPYARYYEPYSFAPPASAPTPTPVPAPPPETRESQRRSPPRPPPRARQRPQQQQQKNSDAMESASSSVPPPRQQEFNFYQPLAPKRKRAKALSDEEVRRLREQYENQTQPVFSTSSISTTTPPVAASAAPIETCRLSPSIFTTEPAPLATVEPVAAEDPPPVVHQCSNKACRRTISSGTVCDKCRQKIKKHQAKTKQRLKLEPRKFVVQVGEGM